MNPEEVGHAAAVILALDSDTLKSHHGKTYIMSGPREETDRTALECIKRYVDHEICPEFASKELWACFIPRGILTYIEIHTVEQICGRLFPEMMNKTKRESFLSRLGLIRTDLLTYI